MVATTLNLIPNSTTDAEFRAWGKPISDALTSFGLTKTADTGQVDWATVIKPTGTNIYAAYEIRQFTDDLQSTLPIFFKIGFGLGASTTLNGSGISIQVGTSTNGAGAIGSQSSPVNRAIVSTAPQTTAHPCYLSGSNNRLCMGLFNTLSQGASYLFIERSKNTSSSDTGEAILVHTCLSTSAARYNYYIKPSGLIVEEPSGIFTPAIGTTAAVGNQIAIYPNLFFDGGFIKNPGITHFAHYVNDNSVAGVPFTIPIAGVNRTYISLGNVSAMAGVTRGGSSNIIMMMLYE